MFKKYCGVVIFLFLLLIISCNSNQEESLSTTNQTVNTNNNNNVNNNQQNTSLKFPSWLNDCNRFQTLFLEELDKYPELKKSFDLPMIYALVYHESLCYTAEELHDHFQKNNITDNGWKGGIMQVDACWRGEQLLDCKTDKLQIQHGFVELNESLSQITNALDQHNLNNVSNREKIGLLLMSYNRGYYTVLEGLRIYSLQQKTGSFEIETRTKIVDNELYVYVTCIEKDVCKNDNSHLHIQKELDLFETDLQKALVIACKGYFGTMSTMQGDYCTGKGYGLRYADDVFGTYDQIMEYN